MLYRVFDVPVFHVLPFFSLVARPPHSKENKKRESRPALTLLVLATPPAAHRKERHNRYIEKP
jgi:hypothetical protein